MSDDISLADRVSVLRQTATFRPGLTLGILGLSLFAAVFEGIGLSFIIPIIELAQNETTAATADGPLGAFISVYETLGIPFTLESVVVGATGIMTFRYIVSFSVSWLKAELVEYYRQHLQTEAFDKALDAEISYFDRQGSDEILNLIVTQIENAVGILEDLVKLVEQGLLSLIYLSMAIYIAPLLTVAAGVVLGCIVLILRYFVQSGYAIGDRVAAANERLQTAAQAGTQGIRDIKLFGMRTELFTRFREAVTTATSSKIKYRRNRAALDNVYQIMTAVTVFVLIYAALEIFSLSFASLSVFLFSMFRLAPRVSNLNTTIYSIEGSLPHLVRTRQFIDELSERHEPRTGTEPTPETITEMAFDEVSFSYGEEQIFDGLSLSFETDEFIAFVGPSGAGKSTIVSLLARMYEPDSGEITADGTPIARFPVQEWRENVSVVRQSPFIFNDTLRRNVTIADRDATQAEIDRVCEIAQVTEFLDDLPDGYETVLGDDGVRLSGGQKQRVALARALLKDSELLLLDEATSDLDSGIENTVHQAIESMERDYAMVVIAHRLSTVVNADRIYTIEDGAVVESGTHDELVARDGTYATLYETQTTVTGD